MEQDLLPTNFMKTPTLRTSSSETGKSATSNPTSLRFVAVTLTQIMCASMVIQGKRETKLQSNTQHTRNPNIAASFAHSSSQSS